MKLKIQIKSIFGKVLFELEKENNTIKDTVVEAVKQRANLVGANLDGANLVRANLDGANLDGANLDGANLVGANLVRANLVRANLDGANLDGANLDGANLDGANLDGANLVGANLVRANLVRANLDGANLVGAKELDSIYIPMYSKWHSAIKGSMLKIGCKEKTFEEWEEWFKNSTEEFSTKRDSIDFKRIQAVYLANKAYYEFLKS
ncbi:uncharacterized protein YjbI with pentapeptide repeats [Epilithonimonas hungarica]|uniref:pentapeptide repeat-containing protein n=1 Tax=Epilithonimonas hungarica TaxID=454006 RepID=UPI0027869B88|nr:pentapeptide repeat-containing protein [Epilithonimonas hungarica]MDP9954743.1 uncharacterized protein YjbI with pentapeptide repeats [Epilithonimonas hungarica]